MRNSGPRTPSLIVGIILPVIIHMMTANVWAQTDTLRMEIGNASGFIGELVPLPVYLDTKTDSCAGFIITMALSRPDLMFFEVDTTTKDTIIEGEPPETTIVDIDTMFVCAFDTSESLASGWDMVQARSTIGKGLELRLSGMADYLELGDHAIPPNTVGILLTCFGRIRSNVPDTLTDRIVNIDPYNCYYSDPQGELILPARNTGGSVEVEEGLRGDVTCDGAITPLDVSYLVNYVYKSWDVLCSDTLGDIDCNGSITPLDVTFLVSYVFKSWPFPSC